MSKHQPTSKCVLCGAETPQDMRYCIPCAGKLLSNSDPATLPADLPHLINEARTIDARYHDTYSSTTISYPQPKRRRLD